MVIWGHKLEVHFCTYLFLMYRLGYGDLVIAGETITFGWAEERFFDVVVVVRKNEK